MTPAVLVTLGLLVGGPRVAVLARRRYQDWRSRRDHAPQEDERLLAELTALGLSAGLSFSAALEAASTHLSSDYAAQVRRALRVPSRVGEDNVAKGLLALVDRALVTGAPLLAMIEGHLSTLRRNERAAAIERARRLPIRLLFPLALLILPGFIILTVGPALIAAADRLGF